MGHIARYRETKFSGLQSEIFFGDPQNDAAFSVVKGKVNRSMGGTCEVINDEGAVVRRFPTIEEKVAEYDANPAPADKIKSNHTQDLKKSERLKKYVPLEGEVRDAEGPKKKVFHDGR